MGGKPLTMTVEGRERYPVRVRYARAFRDDVEAIKRILVSAPGDDRRGRAGARHGGMARVLPPAAAPRSRQTLHVPLAELADVRVTEGPSMIKSENGLLRLTSSSRPRSRPGRLCRGGAAGRRRESKLPAGMYLEWTGSSSIRCGPRRRCGSSSRRSWP